jgi:Flp pilus assembly protein TadD
MPVIAVLVLATVLRNRDYRSETALWRSCVRLAPGNARAHNNLGWALARAGDRRGARAAFHRALALRPDNQVARINLERLGPGRE